MRGKLLRGDRAAHERGRPADAAREDIAVVRRHRPRPGAEQATVRRPRHRVERYQRHHRAPVRGHHDLALTRVDGHVIRVPVAVEQKQEVARRSAERRMGVDIVHSTSAVGRPGVRAQRPRMRSRPVPSSRSRPPARSRRPIRAASRSATRPPTRSDRRACGRECGDARSAALRIHASGMRMLAVARDDAAQRPRIPVGRGVARPSDPPPPPDPPLPPPEPPLPPRASAVAVARLAAGARDRPDRDLGAGGQARLVAGQVDVDRGRRRSHRRR